MQLLKDPLKPVLLKACKFVQRKELTEALVFLGMMEEGEEGVSAGDKTEVLCLPSTGGVSMGGVWGWCECVRGAGGGVRA